MIPKGLKKREQKLTKMMSLIFGCFLVTYLPSMVVITVQHVKRPRALMSEFLQKNQRLWHNWVSMNHPAIYRKILSGCAVKELFLSLGLSLHQIRLIN